MSRTLEKLTAADWIAMGMPRKTRGLRISFLIAKLEILKSKPKLSRLIYR